VKRFGKKAARAEAEDSNSQVSPNEDAVLLYSAYWAEQKSYWDAYSGARHWKSQALSYVRQGAQANRKEVVHLEAHCRERLQQLRNKVEVPSESKATDTAPPFESYEIALRERRMAELRSRLLKARRRLRPMETQAFTVAMIDGERVLGLHEALQDRELQSALSRLGHSRNKNGDRQTEVEMLRNWGPYNEQGTLLESLHRLKTWDPDWERAWKGLFGDLAELAADLKAR
jgi:hypothetical protein